MRATEPTRSDYDAIVVGARCAGASTAMLLARAGLRVLAVDRGRYGSDTLSTHALMRAGVLQLHRWGVLDRVIAAGTPVVRTTTFHYGDEPLEVEIKPRDGVAGLYAPRRTVLDRVLVDAASEAGAEVVHRARVVDLIRSPGGRVAGASVETSGGRTRSVRAGIVIGADGTRSRIARLAGGEHYRVGRHATANIYGYWSGLDLEGYHWYYRPGVSAGTIPTNDGLACVFASMPARRFVEELHGGLDALYGRVLEESAPELAGVLGGARRTGRLQAFAGLTGFLRRSAGAGWALVGDAGYFKDPLTAHGITDALRDAELLARAVVRGGDAALAEYPAARDELAVGMLEVTDRIASFEWDMDEVQQLHLVLSKEMKREVQTIAGLDVASAGEAA